MKPSSNRRSLGLSIRTALRGIAPSYPEHILESMMKGTLSFCLLAGVIFAQTAKLNSDLSALANSQTSTSTVANRLADDVLALAEKDAQPSRGTVLDFAAALTKALAGKPASQPQLEKATSAIVDVLQSSGTPSYRFHGAIDRLRASLIDLGAKPSDASSAAGYLLVLGQEVRGPDDSPPGLVK